MELIEYDASQTPDIYKYKLKRKWTTGKMAFYLFREIKNDLIDEMYLFFKSFIIYRDFVVKSLEINSGVQVPFIGVIYANNLET